MAAVVEGSGRRSSSSSGRVNTSHGRGGAGNLGAKGKDLLPSDLETPTLKTEVYTTGRGGSGNMAKNTDPDSARRAQDVTPPTRRESASSTHVGRGGAANVFKHSAEEIAAMKQQYQWESAITESQEASGQGASHKGFADRGKEWLLKKAGKA
ncbi:hypothetical protein F5884DRAFT_871777 [Xylogone sp. PMI_703]|nr:hypothetical protein F5884DRAFT_871777 [Xylogone sp. PMI_703]